MRAINFCPKRTNKNFFRVKTVIMSLLLLLVCFIPVLTKSAKSTTLSAKKIKKHRIKLPDIAISRLRFVGLMENQAKRWALIATPNGLIMPIMKYDCLALEHYRVQSISNQLIK